MSEQRFDLLVSVTLYGGGTIEDAAGALAAWRGTFDLGEAEVEITAARDGGPLAGWLTGGPASDAPLDEALAGLHRIATAAGIFEDTWHAGSVGEVAEIIAAWCQARRIPGGA